MVEEPIELEGPIVPKKEYPFVPSKVPPKPEWPFILQAILPKVDLSDRSVVYKALQGLDLSKLEEGQRQLVLHLLNKQKNEAHDMENTEQPDLLPTAPAEANQPVKNDTELSPTTNGNEYLEQLTGIKEAIRRTGILDKESIQAITSLLGKYPEKYQDVLNSLGLEYVGYNDETIKAAVGNLISTARNFTPPGSTEISNVMRRTYDLTRSGAFAQYHLQPGNTNQDAFFRAITTIEIAGSNFIENAWTDGLSRYLVALKNNNQFQRDDGKEYQFLSRIESSESKLAENNQQEVQISEETMLELYPDWSVLPEDEKTKARAEMEYIQNFMPEDIELFSKYNENIRFLQFLFRGNRVRFIKDPAVRDLVTKRLLQSFGRNKGFVINQE